MCKLGTEHIFMSNIIWSADAFRKFTEDRNLHIQLGIHLNGFEEGCDDSCHHKAGDKCDARNFTNFNFLKLAIHIRNTWLPF